MVWQNRVVVLKAYSNSSKSWESKLLVSGQTSQLVLTRYCLWQERQSNAYSSILTIMWA